MRDEQKAKILLIDVETFPALIYAWQTWDANALRIVEDTSIASWSAKWLGGKQITKALCDYKGYKAGSRDDGKLMADLWPLLDEADMVSAHNLNRFDAKKINYRFMVHGMTPPSPYQHIDTLREVKRVASYDSHKLNELCRVHKIGQKVRTGGADLWFDCLGGKRKAWAHMKEYNAQDVRLLEDWYLLLRPWMRNHPNIGAFTNTGVCPKCGSGKLTRQGKRRSQTRVYDRFKCESCGGWCSSVESDPSERASLRNA